VWINNDLTNLGGVERRLHQWHACAKQRVACWALRAFPRLAGSALEAAAGGFVPAPIPRFFSLDVREIAPTLNDDLLELYGRAGQVLANRFAFFNSFDQGINWEPAHTPSWRSELHAGDYMLELACTFRISCEEAYARQLRYLVAHWIASNPPASGTGWQPHVLARRARNWMMSADFARSDWERDAEFRDLVAKSLALQLAFLLSQLDGLTSSAARLDASRALLCASRYFSGNKSRQARQAGFELLAGELALSRAEERPQALLRKAQTLMEWNLLSAPSVDSAFLARELVAALDRLEIALMPDGSLPLFGPEARLNPEELADLAALAAVKLESPAWKSRAGQFGIIPYLFLGENGRMRFEKLDEIDWTAQEQVNPAGGMVRLVGPQKSALAINARLPASAEDHQDSMSYELTINDHRVVVDSGGFAPEEALYFPRARAHNVLLVDGREAKWPNAGASALVDFQEFSPGCARLRIADRGFEFLGLQHQRAWFSMENNAWLILDWLEGEGVHPCTSLVHFYPTLELVVAGDRVLAQSRASTFAVIPVSSAKPQARISRGEHPEFPGWFSPEFGVRFPSAVLAMDWSRVELPWLGGVLITSRADEPLGPVEIIPAQARVRLGFAGRTYDWKLK
jgi:hypothetical protein